VFLRERKIVRWLHRRQQVSAIFCFEIVDRWLAGFINPIVRDAPRQTHPQNYIAVVAAPITAGKRVNRTRSCTLPDLSNSSTMTMGSIESFPGNAS